MSKAICIEPRLPGLTADDHHSVDAVPARVITDHVHIGRHRVLGLDEVLVIGSRFEPDVVDREVPLELQIVVDDLFKHVLFHLSSISGRPARADKRV